MIKSNKYVKDSSNFLANILLAHCRPLADSHFLPNVVNGSYFCHSTRLFACQLSVK
jgi:hypothetical protein